MNILVVGTGFVGATHAAVVASHGHRVIAYDIDHAKIADFASGDAERIDSRIYEPGLAKLIQDNKSKLAFTAHLSEIKSIVDELDVVFMCLPTPASELEKPIEERYLFIAAKSLAELLADRNDGTQNKRILIVNKSTVPIGTAAQLREKLADLGVKNFGVGSNPEFLVEGKAVIGSQNPDRVVIGVESEDDEKTLRDVYRNISAGKIKAMSPSDAESVKLLANFELFSRIVQTYNVLGRLCEEFPKLNFENVVSGITADERIPKWGHYTSLYAGGSCFDKDARNLLRTMKTCIGTDKGCSFIQLVLEGNLAQLERFFNRAKEQAGFNFAGKCVALLGTAFKQDTNDVRMSAALPLTEMLAQSGVTLIKAYDPQAGKNYKKAFGSTPISEKIVVCQSAEDAIRDSDVAIICTDWPVFKFLADTIRKTRPAPYLIMDGRRSLAKDYEKLTEDGYSIIAVGSPYMPSKR